MDPGQRGLIAAEIKAASANFSAAHDIDESGQKSGITFSEAAAAMYVSEATVRDAAVVLKKGTPTEIEAVRTRKAAPSAIASGIRAGKTPTERAAARKKKGKPENKAVAPKEPEVASAKKATREMEIIARMKEAVTALSFMPEDAAVVVSIIRKFWTADIATALPGAGYRTVDEGVEGTGSPLAFIASMNLHRRHLLPGQRGLVAAEIKKKAESENVLLNQRSDESGQKPGITFSEAAAAMQVGERTARDAKNLTHVANHQWPLTGFETHNGRSALAAGAALHAPEMVYRGGCGSRLDD